MGKFTMVICAIAMFQLLLTVTGRHAEQKETAAPGGGVIYPVAHIDNKTFHAIVYGPLRSSTWEGARVGCIMENMTLGTIESSAQLQALKDGNLTEGVYWVNARDRIELSQFVWDKTEEELASDLDFLPMWSAMYQTCVTLLKVDEAPLQPATFGLASYNCETRYRGIICEEPDL